MANLIEIPLISPLRPILQTGKVAADSGTVKYYAYNPSYNTISFDNGGYIERLQDYEDKNGYLQPFQQGDTIRLMFYSTDTTTANFTLQLLDKYGRLVSKTITITQETGTYNGFKLYTATIYLTDILIEGIYFFRLRYNHGSTTYSYILFEPVEIKQLHRNTMRIEYYNSYNDQDIVYPSSSFIFQLRVKAAITEVSTESKFNVYDDQPMNLQMIAGIPYRIYEFTFGYGKGIPDWMIDKLERITLCDLLKIDGVNYTRNEGAKFEAKKSIGNPLSQYTLKCRERDNNSSKGYTLNIKKMSVLPSTEYFYVTNITIQGTTYTIGTYFQGKKNFIDYLNARLCPFEGYFAEDVNGYLIFINESATAFSGSWTFSNYYQYGLRFKIDGAGDVDFEMTGNNLQTYMIVWGDGSANTSGTFSGVGTAVPINKTYTGNTTKYLYIFFTNIVSLYDITTNAPISELRGHFGTQFTTLTWDGGSNVYLRNVANNIFKYCLAITDISFVGASLSTSSINSLIMFIYDAIDAFNSSATINLSGQTTDAPPSATEGIAGMISTIKSNISALYTD